MPQSHAKPPRVLDAHEAGIVMPSASPFLAGTLRRLVVRLSAARRLTTHISTIRS